MVYMHHFSVAKDGTQKLYQHYSMYTPYQEGDRWYIEAIFWNLVSANHMVCMHHFSVVRDGTQKPQFGIQFLPTICEHEKIVCRLYCHHCMQEGYCTETIISNLVSANHFLYQNNIFKFSFYKPFASMRKWWAEIILSIWFM